IKIGYSSVMIDASHEDFERNIALTKKVVQMAHRKGISVEAELGTIGGVEDAVKSRNILYTDPAKAQEFVQRTGCDFLAIAIGTSHGAFKFAGKAHLRMDILKEVRKRVKIPLVLHGASCVPLSAVKEAQKYGANLKGVQGVPDAQIKQAVKNGICKFNTDTDLRIAFDAGIRKNIVNTPHDFDPRHILAPAREYMQKVVEHRIKLFGSEGKA
ncbi:MAG TPA: class II fructose-bisphosphate aldolase, partial [Candidatus Nanoarchaeia archaeon]|nr:class II fructose-bisphosphate aldolase [Candidatus Nanoarchaeia archaeon]